jgi:hypothetical protein
MSDEPTSEDLSRMISARRLRSDIRRARAVLAPEAGPVVRESLETLLLGETRTVANELLARYALGTSDGIPDAQTLFVMIGSAIREAMLMAIREMTEGDSSSRAGSDTLSLLTAAGRTVNDRAVARACQLVAGAEAFERFCEEKPLEARAVLLKEFAGRVPDEVSQLLGRNQKPAPASQPG